MVLENLIPIHSPEVRPIQSSFALERGKRCEHHRTFACNSKIMAQRRFARLAARDTAEEATDETTSF